MKKILLAIVAGVAVPMMVMAQGTINFSTAALNHKVVLEDSTGAPAGYVAALYWGVTGSTELQLVQIGATVTVTAGTGFLSTPATRTTGTATPEGASAFFQVRAWNGGFATYEAAALAGTGFLGTTTVFANLTGAPNGVPPSVPASLTGWTTPLVVRAVPEPSTFALAGLGAAALLLFRRRK